MRKHAALIALIGFLLAGCTSIGPKSVPRDRFDYNKAIADSWKEQTLLNIVKLRYADMPLFVEVASIVSGYTLESSVNLGAKVFDGGSAAEFGTTGSATIGGSGTFTDYWFWIDDRDFRSKRSFAYLMLLFSLTESGGKEGLPLVTIPAG